MTHPDPKELLADLRFTRGLCDEHDQTLARALDCAIAAAEKHAAYEPGSNYCLGCYDPWPCPTLAAMTDAWEGAK